MATAEQVKEWQALRGRVLNALWDAENKQGLIPVRVSALLKAIGDPALTPEQTERLFRQLGYDGLISDPGFGSVEASEIRLTTEGRYEVEQWLSEQQITTEHIKVPANQVFSIGTMNVTGPVLQGSTATNVTTSYGTSGAELLELVAQFRQLLVAAELSPDDREAVEADLDVIEEEAANPQPRPQRLRPILRRLKQALVSGTVGGLEVAAKQETIDLVDTALKALPG